MISFAPSKYLNNLVEQDHRFIKRITRPMLGFKAFHCAAASLAEIETAHMIRNGQRSLILRAVCYARSMNVSKENCY